MDYVSSPGKLVKPGDCCGAHSPLAAVTTWGGADQLSTRTWDWEALPGPQFIDQWTTASLHSTAADPDLLSWWKQGRSMKGLQVINILT